MRELFPVTSAPLSTKFWVSVVRYMSIRLVADFRLYREPLFLAENTFNCLKRIKVFVLSPPSVSFVQQAEK